MATCRGGRAREEGGNRLLFLVDVKGSDSGLHRDL